MNHTLRHERDPADSRLDAYMDGVLTGAESSAFENRLVGDPELRAELLRHRRIEDALRQYFAVRVPSAKRVMARLQTASEPGRAARPIGPVAKSVSRRLAVAAVLALGVIGVWRIWGFFQPKPPGEYPHRVQKPMHKAYWDKVASGFAPDWVCKTDEEFASTFERRFGQPLLLASVPEGISAVGLAYPNTITPRTIALLARVHGEEVVVFVDRLRADPGQSLPQGSGLNLHRRRVGKLVLYELSRLDRPFLLELFYQP